ncbi:hypothetical protein BC940DRAFT_300516 [Gongronella butleri]|nr:hypothetical protein BC940DRAFT_300516 [Gongronella butleri]
MCGARHLWRHVLFEDTSGGAAAFQQFAKGLCASVGGPHAAAQPLSPSLSSTILSSLSVSTVVSPGASHGHAAAGMTTQQQQIANEKPKNMKSSPLSGLNDALDEDDDLAEASSHSSMLLRRTMMHMQPRQSMSCSTPTTTNKKKTTLPMDEDEPLTAEDPKQRFSTILYQRSVRSVTVKRIKDKAINADLEAVAASASHLQKLDIYICDAVHNRALMAFFHTGNQLTYVSLAGCYLVSDEAIVTLAHHAPQLKHLDLRACGQVSDLGLSAIAYHCPRLTHLNVGRIRERERITNTSISLIAQHTQVTVLGLAGCAIDDDAMLHVARHRGHALERVSVNNCRRLTNRTLDALVTQCPRLTVFEMKDCTNIDHWFQLQSLLKRNVLLTLSERQNKECHAWAQRHGIQMKVLSPVK